jgi:hypothetical protein
MKLDSRDCTRVDQDQLAQRDVIAEGSRHHAESAGEENLGGQAPTDE